MPPNVGNLYGLSRRQILSENVGYTKLTDHKVILRALR
jgi:hypothetical protein